MKTAKRTELSAGQAVMVTSGRWEGRMGFYRGTGRTHDGDYVILGETKDPLRVKDALRDNLMIVQVSDLDLDSN